MAYVGGIQRFHGGGDPNPTSRTTEVRSEESEQIQDDLEL